MQCLIRVITAVALVLLNSCGGGGGNGKKDPLAQPSSFFPSGVQEMRLSFGAGSALPDPVKLTLPNVETSTEVPEIVANVSSDPFRIDDDDGTSGGKPTYPNVSLTGTVRITRLGGQQGYTLVWEGSSSSNATAVLKGTMQMIFTMVNDTDGQRYAVISTIPSGGILFEYAGGKQRDYTNGLSGTTVTMQFNASADEEEEKKDQDQSQNN